MNTTDFIFAKAKREQAKLEGRLLTKKQKEEKAAAEIRKKALLESGVKIQALQQQQHASSNGSAAPKKVVYGNRKKKGPVAPSAKEEPVPKVEETVEVAMPQIPDVPASSEVEAGGVKDDWEASEEDEEDKAGNTASAIKDSWEVSSDEEEPEPAKPVDKGRSMSVILTRY